MAMTSSSCSCSSSTLLAPPLLPPPSFFHSSSIPSLILASSNLHLRFGPRRLPLLPHHISANRSTSAKLLQLGLFLRRSLPLPRPILYCSDPKKNSDAKKQKNATRSSSCLIRASQTEIWNSSAEIDPDPSLSPPSSSKKPPFNVLITGSSKGIGYALAKEFLREGDNVVICSRSGESVAKAVESLTQEFGGQRAFGKSVDVRNGESVKVLVNFAIEHLGCIDIWINNAGSNAYTYKPLVDTSDDIIMEIVETNTIGVMICCREAIKLMMGQEGGGHIFNMDGAGADGRPTPRFAAYGATKRSLTQLTKSLQAEMKMQEIKNVIVHMLSPGMVTTELLMSGSDTPQAKFFINILAEPAETVAKFLVPRIRSASGTGNTSSAYIRFLTGFKAYSQIIARLLFNARKNRYVQED